MVPATRSIYEQALREGLIDIFIKAGAFVSSPTCGACAGLHLGLLADDEGAVATTNRNFRGRMGSAKAEIYLANTYVAAAASVKGEVQILEGLLVGLRLRTSCMGWDSDH